MSFMGASAAVDVSTGAKEPRKSADQRRLWHELRAFHGCIIFEAFAEGDGKTIEKIEDGSIFKDGSLQPPVSPTLLAEQCLRVAQTIIEQILQEQRVTVEQIGSQDRIVQEAERAAALCFVAVKLEHSPEALYWLAKVEHFLGFEYSALRHLDQVSRCHEQNDRDKQYNDLREEINQSIDKTIKADQPSGYPILYCYGRLSGKLKCDKKDL
jgi:hypothetical protein